MNNTLSPNYDDHKVKSKEMVITGRCHFLTFTLKPTFTTGKSLKQQHREAIKQLLNHMSIFTDQYVMTLERHKNGNAHYHAIVEWTNTMEYPQEKLEDCMKYSKILGLYKFEPIVHDRGVDEYLYKDIHKTYNILNYKRHMNKYDVSFIWERRKTKELKGRRDCMPCMLSLGPSTPLSSGINLTDSDTDIFIQGTYAKII
jgi:hypothetical protein